MLQRAGHEFGALAGAGPGRHPLWGGLVELGVNARAFTAPARAAAGARPRDSGVNVVRSDGGQSGSKDQSRLHFEQMDCKTLRR